MAAVVLESTSLSEYMIELGGPIFKEKSINQIDPSKRYKVISITANLVKDRLKYQDLPMLVVLGIFLISHLNILSFFDMIVCFSQIGITILSALSGYASYKWQRNGKRIDY